MRQLVAAVIATLSVVALSACEERVWDERPGTVKETTEEIMAGTPVRQYFVILTDGRKIEVTEQMRIKCPKKSKWPECWK